MSIKVITNLGTLMCLAKAHANAVKKGNINEIRKTKQSHETYKKLCLKSDEITI